MVIACPRDCYDTCIFDRNYRPLPMFPVNGFTCARGRADLRRNRVNRVEAPMIDGREATLEEALDALARLVRETARRDPSRIIHVDYDGNQGLLTWYYPARLWNALGASQTDYSICSAEGHAAIAAHYGTSFGALPSEFQRYDAAVLWGVPASVSFIHGWVALRNAYKVVIDVRMSDAARKADEAIIVRPGSDVYLAIGVIKELFRMGSVTGDVDGLPELRGFVEKYSDEEISEYTGLRWSSVKRLAEYYSQRRPLTLMGFALGRTRNGGDAIGLISLIPALLGMERGFYYSNSLGWGIDFNYLRGLHIARPGRVIGMAEVAYEAGEGAFDLMFVWNSNPIHSLPGADRLREAVEEGRLTLVVHDPYWSETARLANIVIPAPTFMEKMDVVYSYWHEYLVLNEPIQDPMGIPETMLVKEVGKRVLGDHPLIIEEPLQAVDVAIRGTGVTVAELMGKKIAPIRNRPRPRKPSAHPLPSPSPPGRDLILVFTSHPLYTNSQFKEVYGSPEPILYTHDIEGIVEVESKYGRARVRAVKDEGTPSGVAWMTKSALMDLDGRPINSLIGPEKGKYGGTPLLNGVAVKIIEKKHGGAPAGI